MFQLSFFHARFPLCIETPVSLETTTSRSFFHMAQSCNIFNTATPTKRKQQDFVLGDKIGECVKAGCTSLRVHLCFNSRFSLSFSSLRRDTSPTTSHRSFFHMAQSRNIFNTATLTKRKQQDFVLGEKIGECVTADCNKAVVERC